MMSVNEKDSKAKLFTNPIFVVITALFCCALWGSATPFIKQGYIELLGTGKPDVFSTILFAGIRFTFAGILTVIFYSAARRRLIYPAPKNLGRIGIVALFQTVIQYVFFYVGLSNTTGVKGTVCSGSAVFMGILASTLIFKQEKLNIKKVVACVLGFGGIILVNLNGLTFNMNFTGDVFVLISAASFGVSSALIKKFSSCEDTVVISGYQFIAGGAVMVAIGALSGGRISFGSGYGVGILIYLSFLSAAAYSLWGILLKYNPVSRVTIFSCTTPLFGTVLTMLILEEESGVSAVNLVISLLLVCLGIFILNFKPRAKGLLQKTD